MWKKILILAVVILSIPFIAWGEDNDYTNGLGISGGLMSGSGFSYRYFPMHGLGFQAGGIFYKTSSNEYLNFGLQPLFILHRNESTSLYLLLGFGYYSKTDGDGETNTDTAVGFGMGASICTLERIWGSLDLTLAAFDDKFLPYPQASVHYMLK